MIKAIEENYGPKGKEIATGALYDVGREQGRKVCNLLQMKGAKPLGYAKLQHYIDTNLGGIEEEIILGESGEAIVRASSCPLQTIFQFQDCEAFWPHVRGLLDAINPSLNLKITKALTKGDNCCEFIISEEKGFLKPQRERISLYVNDMPIPLSAFPKEIITRVVLAMASCLKGVGEIRSLEIFLRRELDRDEVR